jgi:hypothetical protein
MQAYDLVDTLVKIDYSVHNTAQMVANIKEAKVIHRPTGNFIIITAQPDIPAVHSAVSAMVNDNFPNCQRVVFVSGSEAQVAEKKAGVIKRNNITDFTDNNRAILAKIKELVPDVTLWVMTGSGKKKY